MESPDEYGDILRALGRIKKEADNLPSTTMPQYLPRGEGRENIRFVFWMIGGALSVMATMIIATAVVLNYRTQIETNSRGIKELQDLTSPLKTYDYKTIAETTRDMSNQREYGVSNKEWYLAKHGFAPASNAMAQPLPTATPSK